MIDQYEMPNIADPTPSAPDAEKVILGALLLDSSRLQDVATVLIPSDFSLDSHRRIMQGMVAVSARDGSVDIVTLCQHLADQKEIGAVGGWSYVSGLTDGIPRRPEIENYIGVVKDKALCRAILQVSQDLTSRAYSQDQPGLEIASWGVNAITEIAEQGQQRVDLYDAAQMGMDAEQRLLDNPPDQPAIATGITALDEFTGGGIRLGELWVIGAAPSRGKTTLARQIVKHCVSHGIASYVHSGEMSKESWFDVTACLIADMPAWKVREPRLMNPSDREYLRIAIRKLGEMPFYLSDPGGIHLDRLIWNAARAKRKHGIQVFAIDYAQIIHAPGRDERQKVTNVAQRLRLFAKDENVATILLSQSPRPEGRNINARPTMFSLKESGALEEAAHTIILPYRPVDTETGAFTGEDELIIGKQRWGAIGSLPVNLDGKFLKFHPR